MEKLYVTCSNASQKIAINPDFCDDPFYRYKVHQLIVEFTKNKTVFVNLNEVATELKINPMYILRYFGSVLGTQVKYDKCLSIRNYSLSGVFPVDKISQHMTQFIKEIILCKACGLPELDYIKNKEDTILLCRSCGSNDKLSDRCIPYAIQKYINLHS